MTCPVTTNTSGYNPPGPPAAAHNPTGLTQSGLYQSAVGPQPYLAPVQTWEPVPTVAPPPPALATVKRGNPGATAAVVILSLLTAAALGLGTYFWFAADRWQAAAAAWEDQARNHGASVAEVTAQLETARAEVVAIQDNLQSAQARITELANERAQLGDQQVVDQNRIDFQARLSAAAGQVASSLELCITRQDELIEALRNPGRYTEESVARFGEQVVQFCNDARTANANLQAEINR